MKEIDRNDFISRYEARLREFGYNPQTLGWGKHGKQEVRFGVLAELALADGESSVLDIGCGFADLYHFLKLNGWQGKYTGVEIVPGLLNEAKKHHPELNLLLGDITNDVLDLDKHDFVIASGVMNAKLPSGENEVNIQRLLHRMYGLARKAVCVDFLTDRVDFQQPGAWHTSPSWALEQAFALTPRVLLRNDYMPFEFSIFLFKNIERSVRNVFQEHELLISK